MHPDFFLCDFDDNVVIAQAIDHIEAPLHLKFDFCVAPTQARNPEALAYLVNLFEQFVNSDSIVRNGLEQRIPKEKASVEAILQELENLNRLIDVFLWIRYVEHACLFLKSHNLFQSSLSSSF